MLVILYGIYIENHRLYQNFSRNITFVSSEINLLEQSDETKENVTTTSRIKVLFFLQKKNNNNEILMDMRLVRTVGCE